MAAMNWIYFSVTHVANIFLTLYYLTFKRLFIFYNNHHILNKSMKIFRSFLCLVNKHSCHFSNYLSLFPPNTNSASVANRTFENAKWIEIFWRLRREHLKHKRSALSLQNCCCTLFIHHFIKLFWFISHTFQKHHCILQWI